jgi:hypothetical protein
MRKVEEGETLAPVDFLVYRKRWLWGEKYFCTCDEVMYHEGIYLMKTKGQIIAILPEKSFSCAISMMHSLLV